MTDAWGRAAKALMDKLFPVAPADYGWAHETLDIIAAALLSEREAGRVAGVEEAAGVARKEAEKLFESYQFPASQTASVERMRWTQACRKDTALDIERALRSLALTPREETPASINEKETT